MVNSLPQLPEIERHKAAISRIDLSRPVRLALQAGLFGAGTTFFDYGCGYGGDVERIAQMGYKSNGWDPHYFPDKNIATADIVNLGYVINVIESQEERKQALIKAWALAQNVLIVAAQVLLGETGSNQIAYGDGIVTRRNTFQKYYDQQELKTYIDDTLQVDSVPVALGVYFVFRDEAKAQTFRAARFRSHTAAPKIRTKVKQFEDYRELLTPLMEFVVKRGRLPFNGEILSESQILSELGSFSKAFLLIQQATNKDEWESITEKHRQDLLVYLALSRFGKRPKNIDLPIELQNDMKAFFGTYKKGCELADGMLFSLSDQKMINSKCKSSKVGKLVGDSLYVHMSALESLDPLLRLYEGCASRTFGRMDGATIVKFRIDKPKVSYLFYPDFDTDPHPALHSSMQMDLRSLYVSYRDYSSSNNPPILHRKETFITSDYPLYEKFARLTHQEEKWGLLDDAFEIGLRNGWLKRLDTAGVELRGHRIVRSKPKHTSEKMCNSTDD